MERAQRIVAGLFALILILAGINPPPLGEQWVALAYILAGMVMFLFALRPKKR